MTSGPFIFTDYEEGEYYTISRNPSFYYPGNPEVHTITGIPPGISYPTTTNGETNQSTIQDINGVLVISSIVGGFSSIIILYCGVQILQKRRDLKSE